MEELLLLDLKSNEIKLESYYSSLNFYKSTLESVK